MAKSELERGLLAGMKAAVDHARGKRSARVKEVGLAPPAPKWSSLRIVRLRKATLGTSQAQFASLVNVSAKAVQSWEQGFRKPDGAACRTMELIEKDPKHFLDVVYRRTGS